jgi:hypothetical protein
MTAALRARLVELVHAGRWQVLLRMIVLVAPLLALVCLGLAVGHMPVLFPVPIVALAVAAMLVPDSAAGVALLVVLLWEWYAAVDDPHTWWTLPAALCVLAFQTAAAASSGLPPGARWPARTKARWGWRTGLVGLATVAAWAVGVGIADLHAAGDVLLSAATAFVIAGGLWWFLRRNPNG